MMSDGNEYFAEPLPALRQESHNEPEIDLSKKNTELLRQFEDFLRSAESVSEQQCENAEPKIGLYQLFEVLAAQRQELKLYTKSGRQTQDLLAKSIEETSAAVTRLDQFRREKPDVERKAARPLLLSLTEIDESLQRAGAAMDSVQKRLIALIRSGVMQSAATYCDELSIWQRFWERKIIRRFAEFFAAGQREEIERILEPFRDGFELLQRRMDDVLRRHSIRRLEPLGEPVDPQTMRVVAVVESESVPSGHVVDVVRPGYLCRGAPLRFADVRAAKTKDF